MAKITRIQDLPEWFDLRKYDGCKNYGAAQWHSELRLRFLALKLLETISGTPSEANAEIFKARNLMLDSIRNDFGSGHTSNLYSLPYLRTVRPINMYDLMLQASIDGATRSDSRPITEKMKAWRAVGNPITAAEECLYELPLELGYYDGDEPLMPAVKIDLGAPDSIVVEAFKSWLKETRSIRKEKQPSRKKPNYYDWADYGLLPYLDLLIWKLETGTQISDEIMGAAISDYQFGADKVRTTVTARISDLRNGGMAALQALATAEANSSNASKPKTFKE